MNARRPAIRLALTGIVFFTSLSVQAGVAATRVVAHTQGGPVIGLDDGATTAWLGIPYAAPPTGALRFRPPMPPARWSAPRDATQFGSPCPQTASLGTPSENEDCLTLNVFRPDGADDRTPVLVFLFGGSFKWGSAGAGLPPDGPDFDGRRLAARAHAVVVTVNYRLGVLGFLASPVLDASDSRGVSGNYGLLDQQQALRWVRANGPLLGYDGAHVALFGQSAGALSIAEQIVSPGTDGLFGPVMLESMGAIPDLDLARAEKDDASILSQTGCAGASDQAACLRAVPVSRLLASDVTIGPVVDGVVIPRAPADVLAGRSMVHVPFVESTNLNEATYFVADAIKGLGHAPTTLEIEATLVEAFGHAGADAIDAEYVTGASANPAETLAAIETDEFFACPAATLHTQLRRAGVPVLQAEFAEPDPVFDYPVPSAPGLASGDPHTAELAYIFEQDGAGAELPAGPNQSLADGIGDALFLLAHGDAMTGDALLGLPSDAVVSVAAVSFVSRDFAARHHCGFWSASGLSPRLIGRIE